MKYLIILKITILISLTSIGQVEREMLSIGDKIPEFGKLTTVNYYTQTANFSDFKGKKIILDFWATWCIPCIQSMPKIDSLNKKYGEKLKILLVTYQKKEEVEACFASLKLHNKIEGLTSIVEDQKIRQTFKHSSIPHYVWINESGYIEAITGSKEVNDLNIASFLEGKKMNIAEKTTIITDSNKPLFSEKQINPAPSQYAYYSILTTYVEGLSGTARRGKNYITCTNMPLRHLINVAFGNFEISFLTTKNQDASNLTTSDSLMLGIFTDKTSDIYYNNIYSLLYTYELKLPDSSYTTDQMFEIMRFDISKFLLSKGITIEKKPTKKKIITVEKMKNFDRLISKGEVPEITIKSAYLKLSNQPFSKLLEILQQKIGTTLNAQVLDNTNYRDYIDITINADLSNISSLNKSLEEWGIQLVKREVTTDIISITKNYPPQKK